MKEQGETEDIFEREWREAFDGVEQTPPRIVWSEIDRALAHEKASVYKRKSVYYRWMAAAIFLLATSIGLLQFLSNQNNDSGRFDTAIVDHPQQELVSEITISQSRRNFNGNNKPPKSPVASISGMAGDNHKNVIALAESIDDDTEFFDTPEQTLIPELNKITPTLEIAQIDLVDHFYRVASYGYFTRSSKNKNADDKFWAGIGVGSSTFDPNFQSSSSSFLNNSLTFDPSAQFSASNTEALDASSPSVRENMQSGQSLSYGFNFGMKLSSRWSVQGGVQYMKAQATNNTNVVISTTKLVESIAATSQIKNVAQVRQALQSDEIVEYSYEDVNLNNEFQFASIPVQAGYRLLDNKFSIDLKAGVAANLYLGNKITDPDNELAEVTIGPGSNSPYKEMSFMGLAGVQFGYEFINRFNLIIEPNYRYSLENMTKNSSEFVASPSGFGLQTGIRYQFH